MIYQDDANTIAALCRTQARQSPDKTALVFDERVLTYGDLHRTSNVLAGSLSRSGVTTGTRVAHLAKDSDRTIQLLFACAKLDAVFVPVNWRLTEREVRFIIEHADVRVLFVSKEFEAIALAVQQQLGTLKTVVVLDAADEQSLSLAQFIADTKDKDPGLGCDRLTPVVQMYTSGTTGFPKGVVLGNYSFFAVAEQFIRTERKWIGWSASDVNLCVIPLFHIGGLWWIMRGLASGASNILLETFNGAKALKAIPAHGVTKTCVVPAMLHLLLSDQQCKDTDFSTLNTVVYGGSPIAESLLKKGMEVMGARFFQIYGMTETGNMSVCLTNEDHDLRRVELLRAAGKPLPGVDVDVFGADGVRLKAGEVGEIRIKSPANMLGYWKQEDATRETLIDGWIHTGDAGFRDEEGYIYVSDRIKDIISYAGEKISPSEIENVLCEHPAIAEAAVFGIPDPSWGESVKAYLILRNEHKASGREIVEFLKGKLADFKIPKSIEFVESLPRTPSGKLQKAKLRDKYWRGYERKIN